MTRRIACAILLTVWAMLILGFMGVGFMAYRGRNNKVVFRIA